MTFFLTHAKFLKLLAKLALTLAAFWFVLKDIETATLAEIIERQRFAALAAAAGLIMMQLAIGAVRWRLVLAALTAAGKHMISLADALRFYYIGVFFNQCLPGTMGGDVARVWLVKSDSVPLQTSIHSVIIDRLIALLALAVMAAFSLPWLGEIFGFSGAAYLLPLIVLFAAAGGWCMVKAAQALQPYQHIRPVRWISQFMQGLRLTASTPDAFLLLIYSVASHIAFCLSGYVLAQSLGVEITLMQCIILMPLVMLVITLPISIGGWGIREASMVGVLGFAGVPAPEALMISVELGLIGIAVSLPAAFLWLGARRAVKRE